MKIFNTYTVLAFAASNFVSASPVPNVTQISEATMRSTSLPSSDVTAIDFSTQQSKFTTIHTNLQPQNRTNDTNNATLPYMNLNDMKSPTAKRPKASDLKTHKNATAANMHYARAYNEPLKTYGVASSKSEPSGLTESSKDLRVPNSSPTNNGATSLPIATQHNTTASHNSSITSDLFSGDGTYYSPGSGACGGTNSESDYIVAISQHLYDAKKGACGKKIEAFYGNKSVIVDVVDSCEGCNYYDLDFSPAAFAKLADKELGRIHISWKWE